MQEISKIRHSQCSDLVPISHTHWEWQDIPKILVHVVKNGQNHKNTPRFKDCNCNSVKTYPVILVLSLSAFKPT